jgi:diadenosine tetraphosphate (Ap4A) HIT family hydrolase
VGTDCPLCTRVDLERAKADPDFVREFEHSIAFLGRWQTFRGYTILVAKAHATELSQLSDRVRRGFFDEMCLVARAIESGFRPRKLNYEMLGNQVPHLHWHVFPRYAHDPQANQAVWLAIAAAEANPALAHQLEESTIDRYSIMRTLRAELERWANFAGG